jgi:cobalt-zinc-cadmium efflux system membrane fusion protein
MIQRMHVLPALLAASALAFSGCGGDAPEEVETETVVPVTTAAAETGTIRAVIHATGDVNPALGAEMLVVAPEPARISEITKAEGDRVRRGEVLVRFDIPTLSAEAASRSAEATAAEARVRVAGENLTRVQDLLKRGVAARKEVEDAEKELADAQASLAQARATRGSAQSLAARQTVVAQFNGVVGKRFHNPGDQVEAAGSDPVLRVIDPARLQVDASVAIPDLSRVTVGATGRVVLPGDAAPLPLTVAARPSIVEAGTAAAPVRMKFQSPHNLAVGTPVQVEIDAEEHKNVVLVRSEAIVREGEETAVFVAAGKKAQRRPVKIGISNSEQTEIIEGVKAGEPIIVHGQAGLPDGADITTENPASK